MMTSDGSNMSILLTGTSARFLRGRSRISLPAGYLGSGGPMLEFPDPAEISSNPILSELKSGFGLQRRTEMILESCTMDDQPR